MKTGQEGVWFRGAVTNGLRIAMLLGTMTGLYDWCKENSYYFLGPSNINRIFGLALATGLGVAASMPFDTIRTRLYTQKALPNGVLPYKHGLDCAFKIMHFESNRKHAASFNSFFAGFLTSYTRWLAIWAVSMYILDVYQLGHFTPEMWTSARYSYPTGIDFDVRDPYTLMYHKALVSIPMTADDEMKVLHPDGRTSLKWS